MATIFQTGTTYSDISTPRSMQRTGDGLWRSAWPHHHRNLPGGSSRSEPGASRLVVAAGRGIPVGRAGVDDSRAMADDRALGDRPVRLPGDDLSRVGTHSTFMDGEKGLAATSHKIYYVKLKTCCCETGSGCGGIWGLAGCCGYGTG